jgi:pimeloyl-ACP methyl ester carboxylesterase
MMKIGDIDLWTEEFGDPSDPPILLIMGSMSQGLLWPDGFIGRLAAGGRRVIRYDHRDTGRSTCRDFEAHPYIWTDVMRDAVGLLDGYGIEAAHIVGHSAGGLLGQLMAVRHPERVATLTVIGSSPLGGQEGKTLMRALMGEEQPPGSLPPPTPEFVAAVTRAMTNPPGNRREAIDAQIEQARMLHGPALPFDEDEQRRLEERLLDRAVDPAAAANHRLAWARDPDFEPVGELHRVLARTLVIEGSVEPIKPGHGALIAEAIPGAELLMIEGMGHTLPPEVHEPLVAAILRHTAK